MVAYAGKVAFDLNDVNAPIVPPLVELARGLITEGHPVGNPDFIIREKMQKKADINTQAGFGEINRHMMQVLLQ